MRDDKQALEFLAEITDGCPLEHMVNNQELISSWCDWRVKDIGGNCTGTPKECWIRYAKGTE